MAADLIHRHKTQFTSIANLSKNKSKLTWRRGRYANFCQQWNRQICKWMFVQHCQSKPHKYFLSKRIGICLTWYWLVGHPLWWPLLELEIWYCFWHPHLKNDQWPQPYLINHQRLNMQSMKEGNFAVYKRKKWPCPALQMRGLLPKSVYELEQQIFLW